MDTFQEHNPKQASHTKSTIEEIKEWDGDELLEWIQEWRPKALKGDNLEKFKAADIDGATFLKHAGSKKYFHEECNLPIGTSERLADLASEIAGGETAGDTSTGNRQQAEDVELSYSQSVASSSLETDLVLGNHVSRRPRTVKRLAELLDNQWIVHVRGTPATGKTTLAYLLREHYRERGDRVVLISRWGRPSNVDLFSFLDQWCEKQGYLGIQLDPFSLHDIIFILDDAQAGYPDVDLWEFIKLKNDYRFGPKICLFAAYGSPSEGTFTWERSTPFYLGHTKRVSILPSLVEDSPGIGLFYDNDEFEDAVRRYCANPTHKLRLGESARTYLLSITNGHPGALFSMLSYIFLVLISRSFLISERKADGLQKFGEQIKYDKIQQITEDDLVKELDDDTSVFSALENFPVKRSFPRQRHLTTPAKSILSQLCQGRSIPFDHNDEGMKVCATRGWVHVDAEDTEGDHQFCFLPSPLHQKYIEYFLTSIDPKPFPTTKFPTLPELCKEVFRHFSKKSLLLNSVGRGPSGAAPRPVEAQYQDEFYRVFKSLLGNGVGISSEWARGKGGRIDFRILGPKWGVEFLVDGTMTTLNEHYGRFLPDGKYHWWILRGLISDWLVIDCRCSEPGRTTPSWSKLWHAVFAEDFSTLRIVDAGNREVMPEVCLTN